MDCCTLYENFNRGLSKRKSQRYLGWRPSSSSPYQWLSWGDVDQARTQLGSALSCLLRKAENKHVGLFSVNRLEWLVTEHAANAYSLPLVPLYSTLGKSSIRFILQQAEISVVVCSEDKVSLLLESGSKWLSSIICMDSASTGVLLLRDQAAKQKISLFTWSEAIALGSGTNQLPHQPPTPETVATICYTSGTTGKPKGVVLSHRNISISLNAFPQSGFEFRSDDVYFSYLPLAHVLERLFTTAATGNGCCIGFYSGDVTKLFDDVQVLRPTLFTGVPTIFNRIYAKIAEATIKASGLSGSISRVCFQQKLSNLAKANKKTHPFWDVLVCRKIRQKFGGRLRSMFSGSAPVDSAVLNFLQVALCCNVYEGYGLTETACFGTVSNNDRQHGGFLGQPTRGCQLKLQAVPEMSYSTKEFPKRGEICLRGPFLFREYYREPEKTREAFTADGEWFLTGDIGCIDSHGNIQIIDRKKNIFKLSQGEYVAPEKLESIYQSKLPWINQIVVYGDSSESKLVALISLIPDINPKLSKKEILFHLDRVADEEHLAGFEKVKNIFILSAPLSIEAGLLTPTLKIRRSTVLSEFAGVFNLLYRELVNQSFSAKL